MVTALDTHELVKDLKASGFTDDQAEALTRAVKKARDLDLSNFATKQDLAELRAAVKADMAELRAELIKWVVGVGFAQVAMILAVLRLFPGAHP